MSEWADAERRLSPESSAEPGRWRTSRAEYQRGFMDAVSDALVESVVGVFGSQTGKTDCVLNVIGYYIHHDPAPILLIQPTLAIAEAWSKDRLAPMLRDTPALRGRVQDAKTRDSGNTILHKLFAGGHLTAAGANSAASLASRPIRLLLCDEVDRYPASAGTEGNPVKLAETRTVAFWNRKRVYISSPGNKGSSPMEKLWLASDQRRYFVACHDCGAEQYLKWSQVHWDKTELGEHDPDSAVYVCERCGVTWTDIERWRAVKGGVWRATADFHGSAGFHVSALAAPWESRRLSALVRQWLEAQGNPDLLKVFVNTVLAEWWEEKYTSLQDDHIAKRREPYPKRDGQVVVPRGVAVLTAGVDVQDDRLEVGIQGYGKGLEQWKHQYHVIDGDPSAPAVWDALWELLCTPLPLERGGVDFIRATCVDTGAHTLRAYEFCRPRFRFTTIDGRMAYVFGVKGSAGPGSLWPREPNRKNKGKIPLFLIKVDAAKESLYTSLIKNTTPGPGFIHFPDAVSAGLPFDARYFQQLTAEKVSDKNNRAGFTSRVWELKSVGRRNEALDVSVYAEAALRGLIAMGLDVNAEAERIAARYAIDAPPSSDPTPGAPPRPRPRRRSSSTWLQRGE